MIKVKKEGIIANKTDCSFECNGILNPAVIKKGDEIHLFYRAVGKTNRSSIGYCKMRTPLKIDGRSDIPLLFPQFNYESQGMEDPRITKIDDLYYLTYTAYNGANALGALAVSKDLIIFEKLGIIVPLITYDEFRYLTTNKKSVSKWYHSHNHPRNSKKLAQNVFLWDKNVMFFPRRINGKLHFLHRIKPDIQIVAVNAIEDLSEKFWKDYFLHFDEHILLSPKYEHELSYVGGGCPPIETAFGWLLIYHGVCDAQEGSVYSACAALFDLENPQNEIARLPYPLFKPEYEWELNGKVNNVCFPTGTLVIEDVLYIYYGAADERIACASVNLPTLLDELLNYTNEK
jgi:predicted GH43/DUF377 family glycosyl hydrolase